jgi:hypothetical protein
MLYGYRRSDTQRSALVAAVCASQQNSADVYYGLNLQEMPIVVSVVLRDLSRITSVTKLIIRADVVRFTSVAFKELYTCTQTLQSYKQLVSAKCKQLPLHQLLLMIRRCVMWSFRVSDRQADLTPVLAALQDHPTLLLRCTSSSLMRTLSNTLRDSLDSGYCYVAKIQKSKNWFSRKLMSALLAWIQSCWSWDVIRHPPIWSFVNLF